MVSNLKISFVRCLPAGLKVCYKCSLAVNKLHILLKNTAGIIVLCSWPRHFTLTVLLSTQVYKCVKGLAPNYLSDRFVTRSSVFHDRNTRKKDSLNIPGYKSASGQRTFL